MPRWVPPHEEKVPVFKNVIYAMKILHKADKTVMPFAILAQTSTAVFTLFFQGVLFLKVLLSIIEGEATFEYFTKCLLLFFAVGMVYEVIIIICDYMQNVAWKKVYKGLNNLIFRKAAELDVSCYEDPAFYDAYMRATDILTRGFFMAFAVDLSNLLGNAIALVLVIGVVTTIDPRYLIFLAPVLAVFVVQIVRSKLFYKRDLEMTTNNRIKSYTERTVFLKDFSKDMRTSNIFSVILNRFYKAVNDNVRIIKLYGRKLFVLNIFGSLFGELIPIVGTYSYASYQFINNSGLDIAGFSVVLSSINSVRQTTMTIADSIAELSNVALYFQNLRDFFEYETQVKDGALQAGEFESLEFKNVYFKYPTADKYSLNGVNLKINKGETTAVVGVNGAGKTTLVKLMLRFYDATEGEVLYNGINVKEYDADSLRRRFATVFQDYKTFALSVNENVLCHVGDDEEKLIAQQALIQSGVWEKIQTLPQGADTVLTREFDEKGAGLSGGEQQKTATARLFARDFDVAILDEPSSALDPIAEYKMYENLIKATENKTVVYISHRLSSAVLSDKIFVLGGGRVLESGNHNDLMQSGGEYSRMFTLQASRYTGEEVSDNG
ncbi:MAG: ABC transporter ATP-binding protein [Ruminococcaceae bacterium]|nr:ABC transporter ATP-binding protein [Oscillospiraceae bacterium]